MENQTISTQLVFTNNGPEYYLGRVKFYDGDMYLFSLTTKIHRLNEEDARYDAEKLLEDHTTC